MSSRLMRILAIVFALGAALAGWWGYRLSQQPAPVPGAGAQPAATVTAAGQALVALHRLEVGKPITAADVKTVALPERVEGVLTSPQEVVGKAPTVAVESGEVLASHHFTSASALARALAPGERAMAIKVDEVIGGGGFIQPGDYVDVLLYLRGGGQEVKASSGQLVLRRVRVLAYGDTLGEEESALSSVTKTEKGKESARSRSAVLAVPAAATPRLMLAASAGELRLAVYGAKEGVEGAVSVDAAPAMARLPDMAGSAAPAPQRAVSGGTGRAVTVYRGSKKDVVY